MKTKKNQQQKIQKKAKQLVKRPEYELNYNESNNDQIFYPVFK